MKLSQINEYSVYYTNRALSISRPMEVLTIIHDKMDHAKTASPCFANRIKSTDGFFKLPIFVTGNITIPSVMVFMVPEVY